MPPPKAPDARRRPKFAKPSTCQGCALETLGHGFVPAVGPADAALLFLGEAPGYDEAAEGTNFIGAAGSMFNRLCTKVGIDRASTRIKNVIQCVPPNLTLEDTSYQHAAIATCRQYLDPVLAGPQQVLVALGGVALRTALQLPKQDVRVQDFHGTVSRSPDGRYWVVPTYHPSHLQRGAHNLFGTVAWDLFRALDVLQQGWAPDPAELVVDPPLDWVRAWADQYLAAVAQDPLGTWLAVDLETPDKAGGQDEGLLTAEDQSFEIQRVNLCVHPDEGVTVPGKGPYWDIVVEVLQARGRQLYWNEDYDLPRLLAREVSLDLDRCWDLMWAWHALQSDLPRGLGFVAPFYSRYGAWKHLARRDPGPYAAIDGIQTFRCGQGIVADLQAEGRWDVFARHMHQRKRTVLTPAQIVGVQVDRVALTAFRERLDREITRLLSAIQACVPTDLLPLTPKAGMKHHPGVDHEGRLRHPHARLTTLKGEDKANPPDPVKAELYQRATVVEAQVAREVFVCRTCGAVEVVRTHRCKDAAGKVAKDAVPQVELTTKSVPRFFWREPFNPDSWQQLLAYMKHRGHKPGIAKKTGKESTDKDTLERLARETTDPIYQLQLDVRAVGKVRGTYAIGTERRLDAHDRIHPQITFKPSTGRDSAVNPNIQNVVADKDEAETLAAGFRAVIVATPEGRVAEVAAAPAVVGPSRLFEIDYGGIEAVEVGWFCRDPAYIRLAKLGVHAALASHVRGQPYDPAWSDTDLAAYFKAIKAADKLLYDRCKRTVHGDNYGLTEYGMVRNFPQVFPDLKTARHFKDRYRQMAPQVPTWQAIIREFAQDHGYLGGIGTPPTGHPYGYLHRFYSVIKYTRLNYSQYLWRKARSMPVTQSQGQYYGIDLGEDGKRCVAFLPQSTAAGVLKEVQLRLFSDPDHPSYIGDTWFGLTPLRAPIHDSLLLEIPVRAWDRVVEQVYREFLRPIAAQPLPPDWNLGPYLTIGVEAKAGTVWNAMETLPAPTLTDLGLSGDSVDAWAGVQLEVGVSGDRLHTMADEIEDEERRELLTPLSATP